MAATGLGFYSIHHGIYVYLSLTLSIDKYHFSSCHPSFSDACGQEALANNVNIMFQVKMPAAVTRKCRYQNTGGGGMPFPDPASRSHSHDSV